MADAISLEDILVVLAAAKRGAEPSEMIAVNRAREALLGARLEEARQEVARLEAEAGAARARLEQIDAAVSPSIGSAETPRRHILRRPSERPAPGGDAAA